MSGRMKLILSLVGFLLFTAACQPKDERPGLWLSGAGVEQPTVDWEFTNAFQEIFIETRTRYGIRHSTTIWCAELDGALYVGSYYDDDIKFWEKNVARNSHARLRIDGRIFDVSVTPVDESATKTKLDERYTTKYDMAEVFGDELPAWRYYLISLRRP